MEQVRSQLLEALDSGDDLGRCAEPCHDVAMGGLFDTACRGGLNSLQTDHNTYDTYMTWIYEILVGLMIAWSG